MLKIKGSIKLSNAKPERVTDRKGMIINSKLKDGLFEITFSVHDSDEVVRLLSQYGEYIREISL